MVQKAIERKCRCHGLSGSCQFRTCWDQLLDFEVIASHLKSVYLANSIKVESRNSGSYDRPELSLVNFIRAPSSVTLNDQFTTMPGTTTKSFDTGFPLTALSSVFMSDQFADEGKVEPGELLYLYDSPEYCEPLLKIGHFGTKGRACVLSYNLNITSGTSKKTDKTPEDKWAANKIKTSHESLYGAPGLCAHLCCNRGYQSELVFDMVTCNCRFEFCCRVECDRCLKQRLQHYCL